MWGLKPSCVVHLRSRIYVYQYIYINIHVYYIYHIYIDILFVASKKNFRR